MTRPLPTLNLFKTQDLVLLNVNSCLAEFASPIVPYRVIKVAAPNINIWAYRLLTLSKSEDAPYAVIANYDFLAANNFAFVRGFRNNLFTQNIPLIAIADAGVDLDANALLKNGVDDCYQAPFDCRNVRERVEFLHKYKSQIAEPKESQLDNLDVIMSPFKRLVDIMGASAGILLFSPVLLITAALIRLESKGPIIYRSKRSGTGFKVFDFFKFRSMYVDADQRLDEIQHLNQYEEEDAAFVKVKNDPRITKVGRIIRKTSIDELPQLFNVLRGDMSLVGNRPLPLYEAEKLTKEDATYRFLAPAGITGLWQVTKRGSDDMSAEERIGLDVHYAKNHSFWYDMKILFKTPFAIIQKENV